LGKKTCVVASEQGADDAVRLEEQVRLLGGALNIEVTDPRAVVSAQVLALARDGKTFEAVRRLRKETGVGLVQAKRVVDAARRSA
jgi:ribosomal protein L7/L12